MKTTYCWANEGNGPVDGPPSRRLVAEPKLPRAMGKNS